MQEISIVLDSQTVSGITGSISIVCWIIVFVPQIYENFCRKSANGLSLLFIILWLAGDIFNLLGAVMQHLLWTMIILAGYYTVADIVLLFQCKFYGTDNKIDAVHLSPVNPSNENGLWDIINERQPLLIIDTPTESVTGLSTQEQVKAIDKKHKTSHLYQNRLKSYVINIILVFTVIMAGFLSWYISYIKNPNPVTPGIDLKMDWLAQTFGYLSAVLYLGSRIPQILLNFKRKSCEGISFLFFLFACLGNTSFIISVLSISIDSYYLLVNASWLIGSSGTLIMDFIIFLQFFMYNRNGMGKEITYRQENT